MDAQGDSDITRSSGSQHSEDMPDYEILGDLSDMELDSSPESDSQGSGSSDLLRNWLQPKGIDTSGDVNLHDYKGWKIEAPKIMLTRAKHFLADEDVDRTVDWPQKFAELDEYFSYLDQNFQGEDWGDDLKEAMNMLRTHWIFEQYHYGRPELTLDFPNVWPDQSKRLPQIPGPNFTMEAEDLSDAPMGERKLILTKIKSAHDFQYQLPRDILRIYIDAYVSDARKFWSPQARNPPAAGSEGAEERPEPPPLNMVKCDNEYYDRCIQGGMKTTSKLMKKECKFKFSRDDIIQSPTGPSQLSVQSLESFAKFRGARRAALEQCLNIFNNAENRLVSSSWDTLMLPPPKVPEKAPGILFTGLEVTDIPKDEARDPLSYTLARNWYVKEDNKWAQWVRPHSIKEVYGERLWRHRDDPIVILPVNYKGPYVEHFMDIEMKRVFDLLRACEILHQGLQRAQRRAPRDFLADILKLVESGINNEDAAKLNLNFRDNEYRRENEIGKGPPKKKEPIPEWPELDEPADDSSEVIEETDFSYPSDSSEEMSEHNSESDEELPRPKESGGNLMHLRPKEEEWLHFLGGPSINKKLIHEEQASGRLELLFEARVDEMLDDINPTALFRDTKLITLDEFLAELNRGTQGPVRRHQFSAQDAIKHAKWLSKKGKLQYVKYSEWWITLTWLVSVMIRAMRLWFHVLKQPSILRTGFDGSPQTRIMKKGAQKWMKSHMNAQKSVRVAVTATQLPNLPLISPYLQKSPLTSLWTMENTLSGCLGSGTSTHGNNAWLRNPNTWIPWQRLKTSCDAWLTASELPCARCGRSTERIDATSPKARSWKTETSSGLSPGTGSGMRRICQTTRTIT